MELKSPLLNAIPSGSLSCHERRRSWGLGIRAIYKVDWDSTVSGNSKLISARPPFHVVRTWLCKVSGSHIPKSTEDAGEVAIIPVTQQMMAKLP